MTDFQEMEELSLRAAQVLADKAFTLARRAERLAGEMEHQLRGIEVHPSRAVQRLRDYWEEANSVAAHLEAANEAMRSWEQGLPTLDDITRAAEERRLFDEALAPLNGMTRNSLIRYGYRSLEKVQQATDTELLSLRNFGRGSLKDVRRVFPSPAGKEK